MRGAGSPKAHIRSREEAVDIETIDYIEKLEDLVDKSRQWFNKAFVDTEEFYTLINKLRASVPEDIKQADRITREADEILNEARDQAARTIDQAKGEASKIIDAAKEEAARLVDESEIKRMATSQAKEIVSSAEEEARSIKAGADDYARDVLADLEGAVEKVMSAIQRGRDKLEQRMDTES